MMLEDQPERCKGRSRTRGAPCNLAPSFGWADYCRFHGGLLPAQVKKARERVRAYEALSSDPPWRKTFVLKQYARAMARYEMRRAKKTSPEHVAGLLRERQAAKAERARVVAENARLRAERTRAYKEAQRPSPAAPEAAPFDPLTYDWMG